MRPDAYSAGSHPFRETREFLDRLALQLQSDQRPRDLGVGSRTVQQSIEQQGGASAREVFTAH